jgi:hypothetical protein
MSENERDRESLLRILQHIERVERVSLGKNKFETLFEDEIAFDAAV